MTRFSGYLLASRKKENITLDDVVRPFSGDEPALTSGGGIGFSSKHWERYELTTAKPLANEANEAEFYSYAVFCVRSQYKILVLAQSDDIATFIIDNIINKNIFPTLEKLTFNIGKIIAECEDRRAPYPVTSLQGLIGELDDRVQKMTLFGKNIIASDLFAREKRYFNFYSCGLGEELPPDISEPLTGDTTEIIRLTSKGLITCSLPDSARAEAVLNVINLAFRHTWLRQTWACQD